MNEYRLVTKEERENILPVLKAFGIDTDEEIFRFIDTKLDKIYDVYLINDSEKIVIKKSNKQNGDIITYNNYFKGNDFSVPKILKNIEINSDYYVEMPFVKGTDARGCSILDAERIGKALAEIQSFYLQKPEKSERLANYFENHLLKHINKVKPYYKDYEAIFTYVENRFFEVPMTVIHDDLLPINIFIDGEDINIIDWEYAQILPYFMDLARFAYIYDMENKMNISEFSANSFMESYYSEMKKNIGFKINYKDFYIDVAISALLQYVLFLSYGLEYNKEKAMESLDNKYFKKILDYLKQSV